MPVLSREKLFIFMHIILQVNCKISTANEMPETMKSVSKIEFYRSIPNNCAKTKPDACETLSFGSHDYVLFQNRTVYIPFYDLKLNECSYILKRDEVVVCTSLIPVEIDFLNLPCGVKLALCISVFSVFFPLFFSMLTEDVRQVINVNWRGLILSVFFFHFLLQMVNLDHVSELLELRYTFPSLIHFFTLVLLAWMTILCHDGMMISECCENGSQNYLELMRNCRGCLLSIFTSIILLITVTLIIEMFGLVPAIFKPKYGDFCWLTQRALLLFFTGPVVVFSLINFVSFLTTYCYFMQHRSSLDGPLLVLRKNYLVHFKLFIMMDISWFFGVLVFLTGSEIFWKFFVCIFLFEEAFIFVVPFNKKIEKWVLKKLSGD